LMPFMVAVTYLVILNYDKFSTASTDTISHGLIVFPSSIRYGDLMSCIILQASDTVRSSGILLLVLD